MSRLAHRVTSATVENVQTRRLFYVDAIQATWDDEPIGLVSVRQLSKVYPSGTPIGTQYLRLPDDDDIYVVLESAGCYKPEYEVRSGFRGLYNRSFERPYIEPCYLIFYKPQLPEFVRKVSGAVVHKVSGPTQRSTQRSGGRPRDRLRRASARWSNLL